MIGTVELGICEICRLEKPVSRKYYEYPVSCLCHGPESNHFEYVTHCSGCEPEPPNTIIVVMKPIESNNGTQRIEMLVPVYVDEIPSELENGKIYISKKFNVAIHLCACGCKQKTVTPLGKDEWTLTEQEGKVTLRPSIGNFMGESPYHAHYYVTDNKIMWC